MLRELSPTGLSVLRDMEGLRLIAYRDQGGIWTIGYGTTHVQGEPIIEGMRCTPEQAAEWLLISVSGCAAAVVALVVVPMSRCQFDALVLFSYNLGAFKLARSTLLTEFNRGRPVIEDHFTRWCQVRNRATGVSAPSLGVLRRRRREWVIFSGPCP